MHLFCIFICISGCASICLDIHLFCRTACLLFSLSARSSACLAMHLAMHLAIWLLGCISACLVACLSVWRSARLLVDSSGCIWQQVWSHINLSGILSARLPILQAVHLVAHSGAYSARLSFWSSAGMFCCLQAAISSICLFHRPGVNPSFHLPIWHQGLIHLPD